MPTVEHAPGLLATRCAICGTDGGAKELHPANFAPDAFNSATFSARRLPDRIRYRMVRCDRCGLVRSDPVAPAGVLAALYAQSAFTYGAEVVSLRATYARYLARLARYGARKGALLEIGCGNGFVLEEALAQGYALVTGVEPSADAVRKADPAIRERIVCDVMRPGLFEPGTFDVICLFQVFDHIADPGALLDECFRALRPGGVMLCLNHNIRAISARLLGARSPIIDIEHTYLYSPTTIARIFADHRFQIAHVGPVFNTYPLHYLARLMPIPDGPKHKALGWLRKNSLGAIRLSVPLGNLYLVARKPR